ncbi:hypothetical protein XENOCAPTIV_020873 [Xenoophorus captivus]|uniref:Uncharacterized protein n=1 Tax=Xenoophorus captivus TaxID=1517983 RepID=A0ABV0R1D4_9TELE
MLHWGWMFLTTHGPMYSCMHSPSGNDITCTREGAQTGVPYFGSALLASKIMVCQDSQPAGSRALATLHLLGCPHSGRRGIYNPHPELWKMHAYVLRGPAY